MTVPAKAQLHPTNKRLNPNPGKQSRAGCASRPGRATRIKTAVTGKSKRKRDQSRRQAAANWRPRVTSSRRRVGNGASRHGGRDNVTTDEDSNVDDDDNSGTN